jgi:hypothetical protein
MWFERMSLETVDGWTVEDDNVVDTNSVIKSVFSESTALMQPQDMRQYVYTMVPILTPSLHVGLTPGAIVPLGRLDISWRSSFGEPGRLLTSVCLHAFIRPYAATDMFSSDAVPSHPSTTSRPSRIRSSLVSPTQRNNAIKCTTSTKLTSTRPIAVWYPSNSTRLTLP